MGVPLQVVFLFLVPRLHAHGNFQIISILSSLIYTTCMKWRLSIIIWWMTVVQRSLTSIMRLWCWCSAHLHGPLKIQGPETEVGLVVALFCQAVLQQTMLVRTTSLGDSCLPFIDHDGKLHCRCVDSASHRIPRHQYSYSLAKFCGNIHLLNILLSPPYNGRTVLFIFATHQTQL